MVPWTDTLLVVELGLSPVSVHFRPYAEALGRSSVLSWAIDHVREMMGGAPPRPAVLASAPELEHVRSALRSRGDVLLQPRTPQGETKDLRDLGLRTGSQHLLLVDLTAALLPHSVWEYLWEEHTTSSRFATLLDGTPCSLAPLQVEMDWLRALPLRNRGQPQDPRSVVRAWLNTKHGRATRWAVKVVALRPVQGDKATSRSWPYHVFLELPSDVNDLRAAVRETGEASGTRNEGSELLTAWGRARARRAAEASAPAQARLHRPGRWPDGPVLYAQAPSAFAGCEQVVVTLAEKVVKRYRPRRCCALVSVSGTFSDRLARAGVPVEIANRDLGAPTHAHFAYCRSVLKSLDPALVHAHTVVGVPLAFALAERGVPMIQHVHVAHERALLELEDQILTASRVIVVSHFVRHRVLRLGVDPTRVQVIYNGIDLPRAPDETRWSGRESMRRELGLSDHTQLILLPARFAPNKRHDVAVQALEVLAGRSHDVHLLLAGEAHHRDLGLPDALQREAGRRGISRRVHFLGFREDVDRLYAAADVLLLPSEEDPIPLVVLEAMAAGTPVVASRSGGIPEMVEEGASGLLVDPGDVNGFAEALRQVLTDRDLRDHLAGC